MNCLENQQKISEIVLDNLQTEIRKAVTMEKQNKVSEMASEFGIPTNNLAILKEKLVPSLPKMFRDLKISADTINAQMDTTKRFKLLGAAEIHAWAQTAIRNDRWSREKECGHKNKGYQSLHGHFEK